MKLNIILALTVLYANAMTLQESLMDIAPSSKAKSVADKPAEPVKVANSPVSSAKPTVAPVQPAKPVEKPKVVEEKKEKSQSDSKKRHSKRKNK